jgi:uncharacterized protein with von Willebrand factor type A (vWA) domain
MMPTYPLLDALLELRRRNYPLGLAEYFAALEALAAGFGRESRASLVRMCQAVWSHSLEEQEEVAQVLEHALPPRMTAEQWEATARRPDDEADSAHRAQVRDTDAQREHPPEELAERADQTSSPFSGEGTLPSHLGAGGGTGGGRQWASRARVELHEQVRHLDLLGDLPVTRRLMKRAWRTIRRMQRSGPRTELDLRATIARLCRDGVLPSPVLRARRRNLASVVILLDAGGSMTPFAAMTEALVHAVSHSGLVRSDVLYFHDVPRRMLYREASLRRGIGLREALGPLAGAGLVVLSDAGAARGNCDDLRAQRTLDFLSAILPLAMRTVWLNPVPQFRWPGTTAELIVRSGRVPMFPVDRRGMEEAMDVLRGRA